MIPDPRDVLLAPVISEKSYGLIDENKYTFLVRPDANKTQIKIAVEKVFNVKVTSVNTLNRQGKRKRTRLGYGKRNDTKRAVVSLAEGDRIDLFGGTGSWASANTSGRRPVVGARASPTSSRSRAASRRSHSCVRCTARAVATSTVASRSVTRVAVTSAPTA